MNAQRLAGGYAPLGWVHKALYDNAVAINGGSTPNGMVNDILKGNNKCSTSFCCPQGFYAAAGWDPVTGLGSLNYTAFLYNMMNNVAIIPATATKRPTYAPTNAPIPPTL